LALVRVSPKRKNDGGAQHPEPLKFRALEIRSACDIS